MKLAHPPEIGAIRAALQALTYEQLEQLAVASGVGFGTLVKIRTGKTGNPGTETVRAFLAHMPVERRRADRRAA